MTLQAGEESILQAATVPLLLSDDHNRDVFCQVAFPHISVSTTRAKFRMAPVDSLLKCQQCLRRTQRSCDIAINVTVLPISEGRKIPPTVAYATA